MGKIRKLLCFTVLCAISFLLVSCGNKQLKVQEPQAAPPQEQRDVGLYPAFVNTVGGRVWGYIDKTGKFVIKPVYSAAEDFQDNGLAVVARNGWYGIIERSGNYIVEPKFNYIDEFSEGLAVASDKSGYKALNEKGKTIFESVNYIGHFRDGMAVFANVNEQGKWLYGYVDNKGNIVIEPQYETAGDFKNGKAVVKKGEKQYAIIGKNGETIKNLNYYFVGDTGDGLLPFKEKSEGEFGFINEKGNVVMEPQFSGIENFKEGVAVVNTSEDYSKNQYGLIDKRGKFIIKAKYNDIQILGEGMAAVGVSIDRQYPFKGSKYAIAGTTGKFLSDFIYYGVSNYKNGYASAYDSTSTFFIDKNGKKVEGLPSVNGSGGLTVEEALIKADVDQRISYYDKAGKLIWKPNEEIVLNDGYTVREVKYRPNRNYLVYYPQINGMKSAELQTMVNQKLKQMSIPETVDGGTELDYNYQGDYKIEFFKKNLLVFELNGYNYPFGAAHGMPTEVYAHADLEKGRFYSLGDLFKKGSNYVQKLSGIVKKQIEQQGEASGIWMDSYKGIKANQPFIITADALKIYFNPYEIAPYSAGFPTFTIPYREIEDIIDTQGSLWQAFHY